MKKYWSGLMNNYCLVCTARSGSYYVMNHIAKEKNLVCGKEFGVDTWFEISGYTNEAVSR